MQKTLLPILALSGCFLLPACGGSKQIAESEAVFADSNRTTFAGPPTIVYKTKNNYDDKVPVTMNDEKTDIMSYPHPRDISEQAKPTRLKDGYLLDNRGINRNVAFLDYSYEAYAALEAAPSMAELKAHLLDTDPLQTFVNCGSRYNYEHIEEELNQLIANDFEGFERY